MRNTAKYVALITPFNSKPKFVATVEASVDPLVQLQALLAELPQDFDIDTAVGAQLDAVGVRVGRERKLVTPLPGFFFTWGDAKRGWGKGIWYGPHDTQYGISLLDDGTYRRLLKAKVLANSWDGTVAGQQAVLDAFFAGTGTHTFVEDLGAGVKPGNVFTWNDPNRGWGQSIWQPLGAVSPTSKISRPMTIGISGKQPPIPDLQLLGQGLVAVKPVGTVIEFRVTSVDNAPIFGWGVSNQYIGGWGTGAWSQTPDQLVAALSA